MEDKTDICMMHVDIHVHVACKTGTVVCDVQGQPRQCSDVVYVVYGMGDKQQPHNS